MEKEKKHKSKEEENCKKHDCEKHTKEEIVSKKEYDDLKDMLQRIHAEFQNYQKRTQDEKSKFIKLSNEELIKKIIPILDNFELALKHSKEKTEFAEGMQLIYGQLLEVLEQEGLQKITAIGKFDPNMHEAIMMEETKTQSGQILQELQKGYTLNGKIIRSAKVKISKNNHGGK